MFIYPQRAHTSWRLFSLQTNTFTHACMYALLRNTLAGWSGTERERGMERAGSGATAEKQRQGTAPQKLGATSSAARKSRAAAPCSTYGCERLTRSMHWSQATRGKSMTWSRNRRFVLARLRTVQREIYNAIEIYNSMWLLTWGWGKVKGSVSCVSCV